MSKQRNEYIDKETNKEREGGSESGDESAYNFRKREKTQTLTLLFAHSTI